MLAKSRGIWRRMAESATCRKAARMKSSCDEIDKGFFFHYMSRPSQYDEGSEAKRMEIMKLLATGVLTKQYLEL